MNPKLEDASLKIEVPGALLSSWATSWRQDGPRCDLGRIWGSIWMPVGAHLGAKMGQVGAKMALSGPTRSQDVLKLANLERTWRAFGRILASFWDLGRDLQKMSE